MIAGTPVAPDLFTWPSDAPRLIGGRHRGTGTLTFPLPAGPDGADYDRVELSREGTLWSYTIQRFPPKSPHYKGDDNPKTFQPYAVGYVELPGEIIVEARRKTDSFAGLKVGLPMRLVIMPFGARGADGADLLTYAFEPA
jgi:uncharacterized OB-fold protein